MDGQTDTQMDGQADSSLPKKKKKIRFAGYDKIKSGSPKKSSPEK